MPKCPDTLKLAIRDTMGDMPVDMAGRAVLDFGERGKINVAAGGGTFENKKLSDRPAVNVGAPPDDEEDREGAHDQ